MQKHFVKCSTPGCTSECYVSHRSSHSYVFCRECRRQHSYYVLLTQAQHGYGIREVILDAASLFKTVSGMADYIGVSFVTIYNWLNKYFGMSFQEFKRIHICKSPKCYVLDIQGSTYSRYDYILKKIKKKWYCACSNVLDKHQIMTNAPLNVVADILRGSPTVEKIHDSFYLLVPEPVKFWYPVKFDESK
jgi:transposase-like protein